MEKKATTSIVAEVPEVKVNWGILAVFGAFLAPLVISGIIQSIKEFKKPVKEEKPIRFTGPLSHF